MGLSWGWTFLQEIRTHIKWNKEFQGVGLIFFIKSGPRGKSTSQLTFLPYDAPCQGLRWFWEAYVIFGIHTEVIFPSWHDVDCCEVVVEQAVSDCMPGAFDRVPFHHHIVQVIISFFIRRWFPRNFQCAKDVFFQLHWARWLWIICKQARDPHNP